MSALKVDAVDPDVADWSNFIETYRQKDKTVAKPFKPVDTLAREYLQNKAAKSILDIGCEFGKKK